MASRAVGHPGGATHLSRRPCRCAHDAVPCLDLIDRLATVLRPMLWWRAAVFGTSGFRAAPRRAVASRSAHATPCLTLPQGELRIVNFGQKRESIVDTRIGGVYYSHEVDL